MTNEQKLLRVGSIVLVIAVVTIVIVVMFNAALNNATSNRPVATSTQQPAPTRARATQPTTRPSPSEAVRAVGAGLSADNSLQVKSSDLSVKANPRGVGVFVYHPQTEFHGINRLLLWLVLPDGSAHPLNGASKNITPSLLWPREVPEARWKPTGLNPYSPADALAIVFGR